MTLNKSIKVEINGFKRWYANAYGWRITFHLWYANGEMTYSLCNKSFLIKFVGCSNIQGQQSTAAFRRH